MISITKAVLFAFRGEVIANPMETIVREFADMIIERTQSSSAYACEPLPHDDPISRVPDITKVKNLLDCSPQVRLEDELCRVRDALHLEA